MASNDNDDQSQDIRHLTVLVETVVDQNQRVLEAVDQMRQDIQALPALKEDVHELKQDMKVVKAAVTATNQDIKRLDQRVTRLEAAA